MSSEIPEAAHGDAAGTLTDNIMNFARVLRAAGIPIGPGKVLDACEAVRVVGVASREDLYWTLHAVLVQRPGERELFEQAFHVFWRNPRILERMMSVMLPSVRAKSEQPGKPMARRLADALQTGERPEPQGEPPPPRLELDATLSSSARERLQSKDFEAMSTEEIAAARRAVTALALPDMTMPTRRLAPYRSGPRVDLRASLRASLRAGGDTIPLVRQRRRTRPRPLLVLCDISGSMSRYTHMLLHYTHALAGARERVFAFVFGTRLTNISRHLRIGDADQALAHVGASVQDWGGGTRIGDALHRFNRDWSRRVPAYSAIVLLITDGLDRAGSDGLAHEMERLHKSCRRLIWLNPLLRFENFEPKAQGVQAMWPHVDELRPVHNLASLAELTAALNRAPGRPARTASSSARAA